MQTCSLTLNGKRVETQIDPNTTLVEFIRNHNKLTGTHVGCDSVQCGACTVLKDGKTIKACSVLALQCNGAEITTVEGIGDIQKDQFHPVQIAFQSHHALQCGFCTPGLIMRTIDLVEKYKGQEVSEDVLRRELEGNLCRCTGYQNIIKAVKQAISEPQS